MQLNEEYIHAFSKAHNEPEWMLRKRLEAFKLFEQLELPELRYGLHIFSTYGDLDLGRLDLGKRHSFELVNAEQGIIVEDFHTALKQHPELLQKYFMTSCIKPEENKFTALHASFWQRGILIYVPPDLEIKKPLHIKLKAAGDIIEHVLVISESMSRLDIIEEISAGPSDRLLFRSGLTEIYAKEYSHVQYASIQNYPGNVFNFTIKRAAVDRDASVDWLDCAFGSHITISDATSMLKGNGARSNNWAVFYGDKKQHYDFSMKSVHEAPDTTSDMLAKGVLGDNAKSIYRGTIKIEQQAARSNGYQKEDTLLMSDKAEVDSIPKLEIDTNDVKCSHGAAVGQIDEDKLFYMMSRGIPEREAKKKIIEGFFDPMLKRIPADELRNELMRMLENRMESL
ncbi:Fe-S cluster assembly protein SufD [Candidatus Woesearchaeota archaeon]|nr:Fe-S cluster assembly protein SufD [Candidatus Woesearchaeota archaeon]